MINFTFPNIILGLLSLALGVWIVYAAYHINHHILFAGWAERRFGPGSGTTFYRILGVVICLFAILVFLGIIDLYGAAFGNGVNTNRQIDNQTGPNLVPGTNGTRGRIAD